MIEVDWELALQVILPALGTGGIIGYWIKSIIDARQRERERRAAHRFDELRKQRELLLEFMGIPRAEFGILHHAGNTGPQEWRRGKIAIISTWVDSNRAKFPDELQTAFITIGNFAGTMLTDEGLALMQRPQAYTKASAAWSEIKAYADTIGSELRGE
ncbi:MAG: hypothetical protein ABIE42_03475 [Candidatus Eisenbacteria bacterium]